MRVYQRCKWSFKQADSLKVGKSHITSLNLNIYNNGDEQSEVIEGTIEEEEAVIARPRKQRAVKGPLPDTFFEEEELGAAPRKKQAKRQTQERQVK